MSANMKMSINCEIIYKLNEKKILKNNIEMVKLEDYTTTELKKMISSFNKIVKFVAYSKLKKANLIDMIRTHPKIKVEEGANAVKLSIKTDEDFEKQKKVKKEKVKKEVEKLDDVKVVVEKKEDKSDKEPKKKKLKFKVKKSQIVSKEDSLKKNVLELIGDRKELNKYYNRNIKPLDDIDSIKKQIKSLKEIIESLGGVDEAEKNLAKATGQKKISEEREKALKAKSKK